VVHEAIDHGGRDDVVTEDRSAGGIVAPHIFVKRSIWATFVTGMMPGRIGARIPDARARRTNVMP
jgi:hypothetical protein